MLMANHEFLLVEAPEVQRRTVLSTLVGGAVSLLAGCSFGEKTPSQQPIAEPSPTEQSLDPAVWQQISNEAKIAAGQTFGPGQTIPGPVSMRISDRSWTITYGPSDAQGLFKKVGQNPVEITLDTSNVLLEEVDSSNHQVVTPESLQKSTESSRWRVRPIFSHESSGMSAITTRVRVENPGEAYQVNVDRFFGLRWYNDGKAGQGVVDSAVTRVVTEAPMDPQKTDIIKNAIRKYDPYMHPEITLTAVVASSEASGGFSVPASYSGIITVGDRQLDKLSAPITIEHELNHAVYSTAERYEMPEADGVRQSLLALKLEEYKVDSNGHPCSDTYDAVMAVFDESSYIAEECGYGHPAQNGTELFASVTTCITNFPNRVIAAINRLSTSDRKAALQIAKSCLELSDAVAAKKGQPVLVDADSPIRRLL